MRRNSERRARKNSSPAWIRRVGPHLSDAKRKIVEEERKERVAARDRAQREHDEKRAAAAPLMAYLKSSRLVGKTYDDFLDEMGWNPYNVMKAAGALRHLYDREDERFQTRFGLVVEISGKRIRGEERPGTRRVKAAANPRIKGNPFGSEVYDPREESIRAIRQGIYESLVRKAAGVKSSTPFRAANGYRLDVLERLFDKVPEMRSRAFGVGTAIPQKYGRLLTGTQEPTAKAMQEAEARYRGLDPQTGSPTGFEHLIENRQDYEETLGINRKKGFYRVVEEVVPDYRGGATIGYFVWPLPPGEYIPRRLASINAAVKEASRLNSRWDPQKTGQWWVPSHFYITEADLQGWLPPSSVFEVDWAGTPRRSA